MKQIRVLQAAMAGAIFYGIAQLYAAAAAIELSTPRVIGWTIFGIAVYALCSHVFGFDPNRRKLKRTQDKLLRYVERWELRSGSATLVMLGVSVVAARFFDESHFVAAVACATLGAWFYFLVRLLGGGYDEITSTR
jgi:hypothetical protein